MSLAVGTFGDLRGGSPKPVDRNPDMECHGECGDSYSWQDYWKGRLTLGNPHEQPLLCDDCLEKAIEYHIRRTENRQLDEFVEVRE
jgi:hypothetical protein